METPIQSHQHATQKLTSMRRILLPGRTASLMLSYVGQGTWKKSSGVMSRTSTSMTSRNTLAVVESVRTTPLTCIQRAVNNHSIHLTGETVCKEPTLPGVTMHL
jgi:hypothetical protein